MPAAGVDCVGLIENVEICVAKYGDTFLPLKEGMIFMQKKGTLSVNTENLMPIIKKWLYSDRDIFVRELVSNACDAISKLKKLADMGQANVPADEKFAVKVYVDKEKKELSFTDNGIGMTEDEVERYINQVAFSGAAEFIQRYEKSEKEGSSIIGHFGLGFYSAFMVSELVVIDTCSYQEGAKAVRWESDGSGEYEMADSARAERGTVITLKLSQEAEDLLNEAEISKILHKYCAFLPYPVFLRVSDDKEDAQPRQINDTQPLWLKAPSECTEEDYKAFYSKVFFDFNEPLFWIHLNVDYPFKLKGILYFPKLTKNMETMQGEIKLYNNQVYVADNIKEIIPEFMMLLKGVIDCPDMPLNVSRSFLQNDGTVKLISKHITKKVADKLTGLFNAERETYNQYWDDIGVFIKYGCMRDENFYDRMKECLIYKTTNKTFVTLTDYLGENHEKHENKVFYVTDTTQQAQYIELFKANGMSAVILEGVIDGPFINFMESKNPEVKFSRIDADLAQALCGADEGENIAPLCEAFKTLLNNENLEVKAQNIYAQVPALLLVEEMNRRMQDLSRYYNGMDVSQMFPSKYTLVLNTDSILIQTLASMEDGEKKTMLMQQIYDLAVLANGSLSSERMNAFIVRSTALMSEFANN